jgi:hypothetical protein
VGVVESVAKWCNQQAPRGEAIELGHVQVGERVVPIHVERDYRITNEYVLIYVGIKIG